MFLHLVGLYFLIVICHFASRCIKYSIEESAKMTLTILFVAPFFLTIVFPVLYIIFLGSDFIFKKGALTKFLCSKIPWSGLTGPSQKNNPDLSTFFQGKMKPLVRRQSGHNKRL